MRVIFLGTSAFAVPSLERLAQAGHRIALCVTQPDRPKGRGLEAAPSPVKGMAQKLGLPLAQPERLRLESLGAIEADVGVVAAYGQLIPKDVLTLPAQGMLGVHPSLLPKYRGAAPIAWALLNGETDTGVTIFRLNERLDAGEIVAQEKSAIAPEESAEALTARLARQGAEVLLSALQAMEQGRSRFRPQDEASASFAPKLTKAQGRIDWTEPAEAIARLVRATAPWPGATTSWRGGVLKICAAAIGASGKTASPGSIVGLDPGAIRVATGEGALDITELQPAGRRRMSVRDFLAGHTVQVGERLGEA